MYWTEEQLKVIESPSDARILVDAGPGTGKTAVACARVAWLIDHAGLDPTDIWMVSFTRTAVHELRHRIGTYLQDAAQASGIRVATIDSHTWAIVSGFNQNATLDGSYEDNIHKAIELLQKHEGVFEYVSQLRHLFIDEAQDVVGDRVELLLELINTLPDETGVTVLADEAQAIYGFSEDAEGNGLAGILPDNIREYMSDSFIELELTEIHRTSDVVLKELFTTGRALLKRTENSAHSKLEDVRDLIEANHHRNLGSHRDDLKHLPQDLNDAFLLFRKRGEALEASGYLELRPHRLRMSGLPVVIHDWVGILFWDWVEDDMSQEEFDARWNVRMKRRPEDLREACWQQLVRIAGITKNRISVRTLAMRLSGNSPPIDLCIPDFGFNGPVVGTIHGAKGREASQVRLYLPPPPNGDDQGDENEEARILFVGASRAKDELLIGHGATKVSARRLEPSGRAFTPYPFSKGNREARAAVEIGRSGDLDAASLVGTEFFQTAADAKKAQARILTLAGIMHNAEAQDSGLTMGWAYAVKVEKYPNEPIAYLTQKVNGDMFRIAGKLNEIVGLNKKRPPARIPYMRTFGIRTLAIAADDPVREILHSPWRESGFVLAPLLLGYGIVYFRR